jgi:hypothetical protein
MTDLIIRALKKTVSLFGSSFFFKLKNIKNNPISNFEVKHKIVKRQLLLKSKVYLY